MTRTSDVHRASPAGKIPLTDFYADKTVGHTLAAANFAGGWRKQLLRDLADRNLVRDALHARMQDFVGITVREIPTCEPLRISSNKRRRGAA